MSKPTRRSRKIRQVRTRTQLRIQGPSLEVLEDRCLPSTGFTQINLDSDVPGLARVTDPNLVNPWGIASSPTGAFWFGDNGTSVSDVVDGNGQLLPVTVAVPGANGSAGTPTGIVYNGGPGFQISANGVSGPAVFLFATEDGTISGWNPKVGFGRAFVQVDNSTQGADYEGLALADGEDGKPYLYAADFGRGEIDVFDQNFHQVAVRGSFSDPNLPAGFSPFNVQNINGQLFVAYAKKEAVGNADVPGAGNGFIDIFSPSGELEERLASGGSLNSPWGMTLAPQSFGSFGGALLVGNNGDGRISAYNLTNGTYLGQLSDGAGNPIVLENLWGLMVGNDHLAGNSQTVYFAAGIDGEQHGLFGAIQNSQTSKLGTGGTLPYDPNSDQDEYPLPPVQGPALDGNFAQAAPTPVLLAADNSAFVLVPTLSVSSEPSQSSAVSSLFPARPSTAPGEMPDSVNAAVAIGSISLPGTLTAFSPASAMTAILSEGPATKMADRWEANEADTSPTSSLMLLGPFPSTDSREAEGALLLAWNGSSPTQPQAEPQTESGGAGLSDCVPINVENGCNRAPIGILSEQGNRLHEAKLPSGEQRPSVATAAIGLPAGPFGVYVLRGLFLLAAAWLPWSQYGARKWRDRNHPSLQRSEEETL